MRKGRKKEEEKRKKDTKGKREKMKQSGREIERDRWDRLPPTDAPPQGTYVHRQYNAKQADAKISTQFAQTLDGGGGGERRGWLREVVILKRGQSKGLLDCLQLASQL